MKTLLNLQLAGCSSYNRATRSSSDRIRLAVFVILLVAPALLFAQSASSFAEANERANALQAKLPEISAAYAAEWAEFNNSHKLDERDGCYFKATGSLVQVLEIDKSGKIVGYYTDVDNERSRCWKKSYLGTVFPPPPVSPYWHKLTMH